ncbi:peptide/nickel transport system ATP-binding protein [Labrys wisconsinensis]|uniref:Peptide/nickel transport system ATP-binding protein n=1 Tax=Labrys wisconsinensis TaxID=425677 RepID=A0ABU0JEF9_9HYPH|nr:peptide/nickel transport system ATP-binding protein [Labrys wisconsinensis]
MEIADLSVAFDGVTVLHGIDLTVARRETLGLVGESGCGKSVTWLAALGLLPRSAGVTGSVRLDGRELIGAPAADLDRVRGGRIAMIFQDPASSLNPVIPIGRQVGEALALHRGLSGGAVRAEARRLFDLVGIPDAARRLHAFPHELSGGQNQRAMIAMALAGQPDLLVADEPTTALDATIQAQILDLMASIRRETGMAIVLISHDLGIISETCERVLVMYGGRIVEAATAEALFAAPLHPYTRGLLAALPPLEGARRRLEPIEGQVPGPLDMPPGCAFAPRCPHRLGVCEASVPRLAEIAPGRLAACVLSESRMTMPAKAATA